MKQIFLAFLLVGLITLLVPDLRERAQPRIDSSREWLGQKLEGPLSPILTPYRILKTESRMGQAVNRLVRNRNRGTDAPRPDEFSTFLEDAEIESVDAWGAPFLLIQDPDSLTILSAGPDLEYETEDDLVERMRYRAPDPATLWRR